MLNAVLETIKLSKSYRGRTAVRDLSLRVYEGDVYGFLGPNGAGKSTTIRMLTGLVRPNHGTARLLGHDVQTHRLAAVREVGAIVEIPAFYKYLSGRENLKIFSRLSGGCDDQRIDEVLAAVGLLDRARDKVKTYSHGMTQRLGIAQALLPNPKLVILDEPTSGLDPQGMKDVRDLILRLSREQKITVFLSSHLLHEIEQVCNRVGVINRGELIAEGSVAELLHREAEEVEFAVDDVRRAREVLARVGCLGVIESVDGRITIRGGESSIAEANKALVGEGIAVSAIVPKTPTLEDLFLRLIKEGAGDN